MTAVVILGLISAMFAVAMSGGDADAVVTFPARSKMACCFLSSRAMPRRS